MKAEVEISNNQIAGLLVTAFEGGTNYWARIYCDTTDAPFPSDMNADDWKAFRHAWAPLAEGGSILVHDEVEDNGKPLKLDLAAIKRGLPLFLATPHGADFLSESYDATTGDVFVQYCLFGDVIYG